MAIPTIQPYELPATPVNGRVDWALERGRAAVLVHDMQRYFLAAYDAGLDPVRTALANMRAVVDAARTAEVPVAYSVQPGDQHPDRRGLLADFWGPGMSAGADTEVVDELAPRPCDIVLTKWRYSAFQRTDLRDALAHAGRDQLVVVGVYAHMGCQVTVAEAFMHDIQPFLVGDAVADFSAQEHRGALDYVAKNCGRVTTTARVVDALRAPLPLAGALG